MLTAVSRRLPPQVLVPARAGPGQAEAPMDAAPARHRPETTAAADPTVEVVAPPEYFAEYGGRRQQRQAPSRSAPQEASSATLFGPAISRLVSSEQTQARSQRPGQRKIHRRQPNRAPGFSRKFEPARLPTEWLAPWPRSSAFASRFRVRAEPGGPLCRWVPKEEHPGIQISPVSCTREASASDMIA